MAYLTALFSLARLQSKCMAMDPRERVAHMVASLHTHDVLQRIAKAVIPPGDPTFAHELRAAAEFQALLPSKINNLHRGVDMD